MADGLEAETIVPWVRERNCRETDGHVFFIFSPFPCTPLSWCHIMPALHLLSYHMMWDLAGKGKGKERRRKWRRMWARVMRGVPWNGDAVSNLTKKLPVLITLNRGVIECSLSMGVASQWGSMDVKGRVKLAFIEQLLCRGHWIGSLTFAHLFNFLQ